MENPFSTIVASLSILFSIRPRCPPKKFWRLSIERYYVCGRGGDVVSF
jgi:hypothetical protein